jgi:hypothetical protein
MKWSNDALIYEKKWLKEIKLIFEELEKEVADKFAELKVDENGVLIEIPKQDMFFDRKVAIDKLARKGVILMKDTVQFFGDRAIKEIVKDAKKDSE